MCFQPNAPCPLAPIDRPPIVFMARALEKTLDDLPIESPWWSTVDKWHKQLADSLERC